MAFSGPNHSGANREKGRGLSDDLSTPKHMKAGTRPLWCRGPARCCAPHGLLIQRGRGATTHGLPPVHPGAGTQLCVLQLPKARPQAVGCCTQLAWQQHLCPMAVKECGSSPVTPRTAAAPVPCGCGVAKRHFPVTRMLRALAHYSPVGSASGFQASPPGAQHRAPPPSPTTTNCAASRCATICPPHPQTPPPGHQPSCTGEDKGSRTRRHAARGWFPLPRTHTGTAGSGGGPAALATRHRGTLLPAESRREGSADRGR